MIDKLLKSSDKIIEFHLGKRLLIDPERIEFRRKKVSENIFDAILYIDGKKVNGQQLEDCRQAFSDLEF